MGAWGHGYFEDDAALDFMANVEDADHPKELLENAFKTAIGIDYLEPDGANAVIVAAAYVDRQVNGSRFSAANEGEPLAVDTFPDRHPDVDLATLKEVAIGALQKVLGEDSELNELWAENEGDYPAWRQGVEKLIVRLK